MLSKLLKRNPATIPDAVPAAVLHLSGPALDQALAALQAGAADYGGIERLLDALAAKAEYFKSQLSDGAAEHLGEPGLYDLAAFMPSVRRHIGRAVAEHGIGHLRTALTALFENSGNPHGIDDRLAAFVQAFPSGRKHRWVRDLAAEALHFTAPGIYPLMTRWIWDAHADSGVLREIWHGAPRRLAVPDDFQTHLNLQAELVGYVIDRGFASDPEFGVDLLCAQVYAGYVGSQGSSYLKTDFSGPSDEFQYTLRMLGLDAADLGGGRTKVKMAGQGRHRFSSLLEGGL